VIAIKIPENTIASMVFTVHERQNISTCLERDRCSLTSGRAYSNVKKVQESRQLERYYLESLTNSGQKYFPLYLLSFTLPIT